nr:MAG TPA: hypothetical protein [Caudoviricetes sp.]DAW93245.1 MAG TPA: hypothetical protein [Caudoviricetes sp.]
MKNWEDVPPGGNHILCLHLQGVDRLCPLTTVILPSLFVRG